MANTPPNGQATFPVTENEALTLIETLAKQRITSVKSTNRLEDAIYYDDIDFGTVVEQAMIKRAQKVTFDKDKCFCDGNPIDPELIVRYFKTWEKAQWETAIRRDDIRKIIAGNRGATVESVVSEILDSLTQAEGRYDFEQIRSLILSTTATDYSTILGGVPANMDGVLFAMRDMYNQIRYDMPGFTVLGESSSTPEEDIRVAISDKLLALIDITKLANVFNLEKDKIFGKLVVIPVADLPAAQWYKVIVYDRMRFERDTRLYEYLQSLPQPGLYSKAYLTTDRQHFESPLFKAAQLDCTVAATAQMNTIIKAPDTPEEDG